MGCLTSAGLGLISCTLPVQSSPPEGVGLAFYANIYLVGIFGATVGAALQLPHRRLVFPAIGGCIASLIALTFVAFQLHRVFGEELRALEKWEFLTLVLAMPILGFGKWWPVDFINNRWQREAANASVTNR